MLQKCRSPCTGNNIPIIIILLVYGFGIENEVYEKFLSAERIIFKLLII